MDKGSLFDIGHLIVGDTQTKLDQLVADNNLLTLKDTPLVQHDDHGEYTGRAYRL